MILKTENIDKFFHDPNEFQVLKNIEFDVKKGEFLSMIGKSGFLRWIPIILVNYLLIIN